MRRFVLVPIAAAGLTLALPAAAQAVDTFTGFRVEGLAGYDHLREKADGAGSEGRSGLLYGGGLGYDLQAGRVVFGAEGEITGSTIRSVDESESDRYSVDVGRDLYVGGRLGYAISPAVMVYGKGGYTNARIEGRYEAGTVTEVEKVDLDGFRLGAGLEYRISHNMFVKGEYRYSHYSKLDGEDLDLDRHQLVAGFGVRF